MAILSQKLKIERAIEGTYIEQDHRSHLGASVIGKQCYRQIWYSWRWVKAQVITSRLQRLFNRGHWEELVVVKSLLDAGVKVTGITIDQSIRDIFKTIFNHDLPEASQEHATFAFGHGGGSKDGSLYKVHDAPKTAHLLEVKTAHRKGFARMKNNGMKKAEPGHYTQTQIYMHLFKLKRALYIMVCKDNDERHYQRIKYDKKHALESIKKAEQIVQSETPPTKINQDPSFYLCRWCDYKQICHSKVPVEKNCRTCRNADILDEGVWACSISKKSKKPRSYKKQRRGCGKWAVSAGLG